MATEVGIGFSLLASHLEAARGAMQQALQPLAEQEPNLVVLFSTTDLEPGQVLAGVRAVAGEVPLVGGCSAGIIIPQGLLSSGVAVLALRCEEMEVVTDIVPGPGQDPVGTGRTLVRRLWAGKEEVHRDWNGFLLTLISNLGGREAILAETMGDELGPLCHLIGGGAQDPSGHVSCPIFLNSEPYGEAVAGALLLTPEPVGVGTAMNPWATQWSSAGLRAMSSISWMAALPFKPTWSSSPIIRS